MHDAFAAPAFVLTAIGHEAGSAHACGELIAQHLPEARWHRPLDERERAAEWIFPDDPREACARLASLRDATKTLPIDLNLQALPAAVRTPADMAMRRKRLLVADMDSTIINQECIDEIAVVAGVGARVAAITERAMRGELDFEAALNERVALLTGLPVSTLHDVFDNRITLMAGATTLIATMKAHGALCALVSGGFTFFTSRIAAKVGFDTNRANTLEIVDGALTGQVTPPILGRAAKLEALQALSDAQGLTRDQTLAVGDGANDLAMIEAAGLGIAYRAKPIVAAKADAAINHGDLTALLYLQGYRDADFALTA
ncbi:MAG: phosphoserine phosphatase SerB [Pseudomonadota bacterium]